MKLRKGIKHLEEESTINYVVVNSTTIAKSVLLDIIWLQTNENTDLIFT